MAAQQKKKAAKGTRNADRRNGKAWKGGVSPEKRAQAAPRQAEVKRARKAASDA